MSEYNWYVVRAVSQQEKKIKNYIESEAQRRGLTDYIPGVHIPTEKTVELRNGKKVVREKNTLPGYILVNADLSNGEVLHLIKSIPGVIGFLGKNGGASIEPEPLRQSEVNRLLGVQEAQEEGNIDSTLSYEVGETVKVIEGPFSGFDGTVEEVFDDKKKISVSVKIFGRSTPVELGYLQVEKLQ